MYTSCTIHVYFIINLDVTSLTCDKPAVCPGDTVVCTCIVGYSNALIWTSEHLIGLDDIQLEFPSDQNVSSLDTFAVFTGHSNLNGVTALESSLTSVVSSSLADNIILTCVNTGRENSRSVIIPLSSKCFEMTLCYL